MGPPQRRSPAEFRRRAKRAFVSSFTIVRLFRAVLVRGVRGVLQFKAVRGDGQAAGSEKVCRHHEKSGISGFHPCVSVSIRGRPVLDSGRHPKTLLATDGHGYTRMKNKSTFV